jgi:hypothetical protein
MGAGYMLFDRRGRAMQEGMPIGVPYNFRIRIIS